MKSIEEKIRANDLEEISEEEWEIILQNEDIKNLLLEKIKEGVIFDTSEIPEEFYPILFSKEYFVPFLNSIKEDSISHYLSYFCNFEEDIEEETPDFLKEGIKLFKEYFEKNKKEIFDLFLNNIDIIYSVSQIDFINLIIEKKLNSYSYLIKVENPDEKIENFIINSIDKTEKKLKTYSKRIEEACLNAGKSKLLIDYYEKSDKLADAIIEDIGNGKINYNEVSYSFLNSHNDNIIVIKLQILNSDYYGEINPELLKKYPELVEIVAEAIKEHKISEYRINDCYDYPEIIAALLEVSSSPYNMQNIIDNENFINSFNNNKSLIMNSINTLIKNDPKNKVTIFYLIAQKSNYILFDELLKNIVSQLSLSDVIDIYNAYMDKYSKVLEEYGAFINFNIESLPENFDLNKTYSETILLKIIPILNIGQLTYDNFAKYLNNPSTELLDAIIVRLSELRSDKFNDYISSFLINLTPKTEEIILREDNPLNLNILQIIRGGNYNLTIKYLNNLFKSKTKLTADEFSKIFELLVVNDNFGETEFNIMKNLLNCDVDINPTIFSNLSYIQYVKNDYSEEIDKLIRNFLYKFKNVPLELTSLYDEDLRKNSTYDFDSLSTNPMLYDVKITPDDFVFFILEAIRNNHSIDLTILYNLVDSKKLEPDFLMYKNITYTHKDTFRTIINIINNVENNNCYEQCIANWLNITNIEYIFNDYYDSIINKIFDNEKLFKIFIDKTSNLDLNYHSSLLNCLTKNYSEEFNPVVKQFIHEQINNRKINTNPIYINLSLLELNDPVLEDFLVKEYFSKSTFFHWMQNDSGQIIYEFIKRHKRYYDAFIENIKSNPNVLINARHANFINKNSDLKKIYIEGIKTGKIYFPSISMRAPIIRTLYYDFEIIKAFLEVEPSHITDYITNLIHNPYNIKFISNEIFEYFTDLIVTTYNINKESFLELYNLYGVNELLLLENDSILELLRKDVTVTKRFIEIFKVRKLDKSTIEAINDSIQQNIYTIENPNEINIYTNILEKIQQGITPEEIQNIINILCQKDNTGNYIYMPLSININDSELTELYKKDKEGFLILLIEKIKINQNIYAPILNLITSNYLKERRNEINREEDIYKDTNIKYHYDEKQLYDAYFKFYKDKRPGELMRHLKRGYNEGYPGDYELDLLTIKFLHDPNSIQIDKDTLIKIRKNIVSIKNRLASLLFCYIDPDRIDPEYLKNVDKIIDVEERQIDTQDIGKINFETILRILDDKDKYECLIRILNKYKILDWNDIFDVPISKLTLGEDTPELYNFINAFSTIYDQELSLLKKQRRQLIEETIEKLRKEGKSEESIKEFKEKMEAEPYIVNFSPFKILKYSSIYSAIPNGYKIIFGLEDFNLIKNNPEANAARNGTMQERLDYNAELMLKMIENDDITIPSFTKECVCGEEKKKTLRAIVGCKADPRNLTLGERTGACMRAHGHAHSLFTFTNTDPRGFHIIFEDPVDGTFISRVSGFRNGNTVFLNQLRYSVDTEKYSNFDVIEACRAIASELIEKSKNSPMPIENVVCSPCYSLEGAETQTLSEYEIGRNVYSGYKDVSQNAVVLATTGENGIAVPLKLNPEQPLYKSCRLPIKYYTYPNIDNKEKILIQRINLLGKCKESSNNEYYKYADFDFEILETDFVYIILGQDFYVALDNQGKIINNIISEEEEAKKEYEGALEKISEYKDRMLGGTNNARSL